VAATGARGWIGPADYLHEGNFFFDSGNECALHAFTYTMTTLMIVVSSVRPGRIGLPIARWVEAVAADRPGIEVDFADLAEINLPFMDEPNHPAMRKYTKQHTKDWSARVDAADAIIFVTPEYNHSYAPALKNAIDFLSKEWWRKPLGFVSYGGVSGGTRGVTELAEVVGMLGMVRAGAIVEIPFAGRQVADGVFSPSEKESSVLENQFIELEQLATALRPLQNRALEL
jgi:NAD(P)H-dependent FMN reductase